MIGTVIKDQYRIDKLIGKGAMGVVYEAFDLELERSVALKFFSADLAGNEVLLKRFRDELKTLAGFNHPNIATLFTSANWQGQPVMVMELVDGETFQNMVERRGPIPAEVSVPLANQALAGVGSAHRKNIVHRDLKPANLMLNREGIVKVMDFGIAKIRNAPGLTRTNAAIGTPLYMAPEQFRGTGVDARTDIYAMGVTVYEMLAGQPPFLGDSEYAIYHAHLEVTPEPPTVHYPHIPSHVVRAVMRALEKEPDSRFQSAEEFAAALGDGRESRVTIAPAAAPVYPPEPSAPAAIPSSLPSGAGTQPQASAAAAAPSLAPSSQIEARTEAKASVTSNVSPAPSIATTKPAGPDRSKLIAVAMAAAAVLVLAASGFWVYSRYSATPASDTKVAVSSPAPSQPLPPRGGGSDTIRQDPTITPAPAPPIDTNPVPKTPNVKPPDTKPEPKPDPKKEARVITPTPEPAPPPPAAKTVSLVEGKWTGTYDTECDGPPARGTSGKPALVPEQVVVTMDLREPSMGTINGRADFIRADHTRGSCQLGGSVVGGKNVFLKALSCSGPAPVYFSSSYTSQLRPFGSQLAGQVAEEEGSCTVDIKLSKAKQ